MKHFFCLLLLASLSFCHTYAQQSDYYGKARDLYRAAAAKTKCPDRAAVLMQYADWNQCMVDQLAGRSVSCAASISTPIPACDGDAMGSGSSSGGGTYGSPGGGAQAANNAVAAIGNGILAIIQNNQAKRNSITSALTTSFAQSLYNNKINLNYFQSTVCSNCHGRGWTKEGDFSPVSCVYCNGLGKLYALTDYFQRASKEADPKHPAISALVNFLNSCQSEATIYDYTLDGYRGSTSMKVTSQFFFLDSFLVVVTTYAFTFKKSNGSYDIDASLNNSLDDSRVIPLGELLGVSIVQAGYQSFGNNSVKSDQHYALSAANGENIDFQSGDYSLVNTLTDLINKAKLEQSN
jgi:hypothetical protein